MGPIAEANGRQSQTPVLDEQLARFRGVGSLSQCAKSTTGSEFN